VLCYGLSLPNILDNQLGKYLPFNYSAPFCAAKRAIRIMTFSKFDEHSSPIFKSLKIIKLCDLVTLHIAIFMFKFHHQMLPPAFELFFTPLENVHNYNTRSLATQSYYLPKIRTNYGKFNVRFQGPIVWNNWLSC
jgi:hypothetical protein